MLLITSGSEITLSIISSAALPILLKSSFLLYMWRSKTFSTISCVLWSVSSLLNICLLPFSFSTWTSSFTYTRSWLCSFNFSIYSCFNTVSDCINTTLASVITGTASTSVPHKSSTKTSFITTPLSNQAICDQLYPNYLY